MVSTMRACSGLLSLALLLGACSQPSGDSGFRIQSLEIFPGYQNIRAQLNQHLALSRDAVEAIEHGVPLTMTLDLELRDSHDLSLLASEVRHYVIQYLPLSEHFTLTREDNGEVSNFPRLRHALAALSRLDLVMKTGALAPGEYEIRARMRLDNERLPAPMRLPALLASGWQHQSEWSTWPFVISA
jgi:hypothetical protein